MIRVEAFAKEGSNELLKCLDGTLKRLQTAKMQRQASKESASQNKVTASFSQVTSTSSFLGFFFQLCSLVNKAGIVCLESGHIEQGLNVFVDLDFVGSGIVFILDVVEHVVEELSFVAKLWSNCIDENVGAEKVLRHEACLVALLLPKFAFH